MRLASAIATHPQCEEALEDATRTVLRGLDGQRADLIACFASASHRRRLGALVGGLRRHFPEAFLLGCLGESVIGAGREIEEGPGFALLGASLPEASLVPISIPADAEGERLGRTVAALAHTLEDPEPSFLVIGDPFTAPSESLLLELDRHFPGRTVLGGLASGGRGGPQPLLFGDGVQSGGMVGVALGGDVVLDPIVAQGCRPVGHPMFITRCDGQRLDEVDGRSPIDVLNELFAVATPEEQDLYRSSLFLGLEMRPQQDQYGQGDFLIRNIVGAEPEKRALLVAAPLREREVVQFHLRDGRTAATDLRERLKRYAPARPPAGSLLFSCLGRGKQLYGEADHDSRSVEEALGALPIAGFFGNGEIGPVGDRSFLHGYTSAIGVFRPR